MKYLSTLVALILALSACQVAGSAEKGGKETAVDDRSIMAIPANFVGRYEAQPEHCDIPMATRDDDDVGAQGGALVVIEPHSLYFVQAFWPIQRIEYQSPKRIGIQLLNDVDANGAKIEITKIELSLDANDVLQMSDVSQKYTHCPEERDNAPNQ